MNVVIAGGGVGGLTLGLMLHQRGIACTILEATPEMHEIGVGINVLPNAVHELAALGLLPALDAAGIRTRELRYANTFGRTIWAELRGLLRHAAAERLGSALAPRARSPASPRTRRASRCSSRTERRCVAISWSASTASTKSSPIS